MEIFKYLKIFRLHKINYKKQGWGYQDDRRVWNRQLLTNCPVMILDLMLIIEIRWWWWWTWWWLEWYAPQKIDPIVFSKTLAKCCKEDQLDQGWTMGHTQVEQISNFSRYKDLHSENTSGWWWRERRAWKKENRPLVSPIFSWKRQPGWFTIFWWVWVGLVADLLNLVVLA